MTGTREPRTAAGRALLYELPRCAHIRREPWITQSILAIEAEASLDDWRLERDTEGARLYHKDVLAFVGVKPEAAAPQPGERERALEAALVRVVSCAERGMENVDSTWFASVLTVARAALAHPVPTGGQE